MQATPENAACRRFLRCYYLTEFWYDFVFAYAIYTVYFSLRGLTVFDISLLLSWWAFAAMALEVPTGALADSWSRRKMLALAPLIKSLCFVTWFVAGGRFWLFALGFLLWALGSSFVSGTSEALLYDTLAHYGKREQYEKALGKREFYFHIALAVSTITGGLIAAHNLDLAILLSVIPLLLSAAFAWLIREMPKAQSTEEIHYLSHIWLALREMKSNRILLYLIVYLLGVTIFADLEEFDQLYYRLAGLPIAAFGVASFAGSTLSGLAARLGYRMKERHFVMYALPVGSAALLVLVSRHPSILAIGLLLVSYAVTVPARVLAESRIQHSITGASRATLTSGTVLVRNAFGVVIPVIFGLISRVWNLQAIYLSGAIVLFAASVWAFGVRDHLDVRTADAPTQG